MTRWRTGRKVGRTACAQIATTSTTPEVDERIRERIFTLMGQVRIDQRRRVNNEPHEESTANMHAARQALEAAILEQINQERNYREGYDQHASEVLKRHNAKPGEGLSQLCDRLAGELEALRTAYNAGDGMTALKNNNSTKEREP